jgi:hypothetical protein
VFINPSIKEYENDKEYKRTGEIPGHLYWQAKVKKFGLRRSEQGMSDEYPEVSLGD